MDLEYCDKPEIEGWQLLVHVCRRWRSIVFRSPHFLDLKLCCTPETPVKDTLDVWPALPLIIEGALDLSSSTDNVITALGQSNRVCQVGLGGCKLGEVLAAMQVPFPELTDLQLWSEDETPVVIPDSFLGGSAPRLRFLTLDSISFPGLPKLLLSATHLVKLHLYDIPHFAYISPQAIVALLSNSMLSSLESLGLGFRTPQSRPDWEIPSLPPPKRSILSALTEFRFKGVTEYLEELMTRIDTPQLIKMNITLFNQIDFHCPRLARFINCTPTLRSPDEAHMEFDDSTDGVTLRYRTSKFHFDNLLICISCGEPDWQLSSIEQVCNWSLPPLFTVEALYIVHRYSELVWKNEVIENTLWLQVLLPFTGVKDLYLSKEFAPGIATALRELVGGRITEVLPGLQNIFVEGLELPTISSIFQENIEQFVAARQLSEHPIAVSDWNRDLNSVLI